LGIGKAESKRMKFSIAPPKRRALIFRDELISETPKTIKSIREGVEFQHLPEHSGKTFIAPENILGLSTEGQVVTPTELKDLGRVGSKLEYVESGLSGKYTTYFKRAPPPEFIGKSRFLSKTWDKLTTREFDIYLTEAKTKPVKTSDFPDLDMEFRPKRTKTVKGYKSSYGVEYFSLVDFPSLSVGSGILSSPKTSYPKISRHTKVSKSKPYYEFEYRELLKSFKSKPPTYSLIRYAPFEYNLYEKTSPGKTRSSKTGPPYTRKYPFLDAPEFSKYPKAFDFDLIEGKQKRTRSKRKVKQPKKYRGSLLSLLGNFEIIKEPRKTISGLEVRPFVKNKKK